MDEFLKTREKKKFVRTYPSKHFTSHLKKEMKINKKRVKNHEIEWFNRSKKTNKKGSLEKNELKHKVY
jgi:hypothetical protein